MVFILIFGNVYSVYSLPFPEVHCWKNKNHLRFIKQLQLSGSYSIGFNYVTNDILRHIDLQQQIDYYNVTCQILI